MSLSQKHADTERDAETVVHRGDSIHRSSLPFLTRSST